ncbi:MAG TPA: hypothetical protein VGD78_06935 [Chthoniobacterales bacterium]
MDHAGSSASFDTPVLPVRSPRTSVVLAELARQRRLARAQRRMARRRWSGWWHRVRNAFAPASLVAVFFPSPQPDRPQEYTGQPS